MHSEKREASHLKDLPILEQNQMFQTTREIDHRKCLTITEDLREGIAQFCKLVTAKFKRNKQETLPKPRFWVAWVVRITNLNLENILRLVMG